MNERPTNEKDERRDAYAQEGSIRQNVLADESLMKPETSTSQVYKEADAPSFPDTRRRRQILVACCVLIFSKTVAPPLWVLIPPAPAQAFGAHDLVYRLATSGSTLVFMAFLLVGGVVGDLYGRRRLLLVGCISFVLANVLCIFSTSLPMFLVCRLLIGASGALMSPLILVAIRLSFPQQQRVIAIGIYTAVVGVGMVVGPLAAQLLIYFWDWRLTYLLSIVGGIIGTVLAWHSVQESRVVGGMRRGDAIGTVAWSAVLLSLLFGVIEVNGGAFSHLSTSLAIVLGAGGIAVLAWLELRPSEKILRRAQLNKRKLAIVIVGGCLLNGVFVGCCLQIYSFLISIRDYSVVQIILAFAPLLPALLIPVLVSARVSEKFDERTQVAVGFLLLAAGSFALSFIQPQTTYWSLLFPLFVLGLGYGTTSMHLTNEFMSHVAPDLAGTAAGINNAYTQVGSSFGATALAAGLLWFGTAAYAFTTNLTPEQIRQYVTRMNEITQHTLALGTPSLLPLNLHELGPAYEMAYTQGLGRTLLVAGVICLVMAVLIWFGLRGVSSSASPSRRDN